MARNARGRAKRRVGASLKPCPRQLPPTSFPTTDSWCDKHRNVPGFIRLHVEIPVMPIRDIGHHQTRQSESAESLVQQGVELGPYPIFLGAGDVAICTLIHVFHFGGWRFWLMVIEIVEAPPSRICIALGIHRGNVMRKMRTKSLADLVMIA